MTNEEHNKSAAPQGVAYAELPDCGEAGHTEGRCGNSQCFASARAVIGESFLEIPDVQDESGINAYYSRELVLECIDAALASNGQAPAGATDDQRELLEDAAFLLRKYRKLCVEIGRGDSQHLDRVEAAAVAVRALYSNPTTTAQAAPAAGAVAGQITEVMIDAATNALVLMEEGTDTSALATGEADYMRSIARATVEAALAAAPTPAAQADSVLEDAAWEYTAKYEGDDRQDIRTDVFNAFCAGAKHAARKQGAKHD